MLLEPRSEGEEAAAHAPKAALHSKPTTTQQRQGKAGRGQGRQGAAGSGVATHTAGNRAAAVTGAAAAAARRLANREQVAGGAEEQLKSQREKQIQLPPPPSQQRQRHQQGQRQWQQERDGQKHPAAEVPWQHKRTRSDAAQPPLSKAPRLGPEPKQGQGRLLAQAAYAERGVEGDSAAGVSPQGQASRLQQQAQRELHKKPLQPRGQGQMLQQQRQVQGQGQGQAAPMPLVWANVCGMWWPGQLLEVRH